MKLRFKSITSFIFLLLIVTFIAQAYWLRIFYNEQSAKLDLDIMASMRTADYKEVNGRTGQQPDASQTTGNPDLSTYNDLLQVELMEKDIILETFVELVDLKNNQVISHVPKDISSPKTSDYQRYTYSFDLKENFAYRLNVKQPDRYLLKQMSGILGTSFLMIMMLLISYIYLLRVIYRQKTLDEIKSDFVNNMTHELKTPVSVAYAATDALQNYGIGDDPEKRDQYLNMAKEQLMHLNGLIEQILTMSVEERKNLEFSEEVVSLSELFQQVKNQFLLNAPKEVRINVDVKPEDLSIKTDKVHFQNVINNLVENSIKYSGDQVSIFISAEIKKGKTCISIKDNGLGISQEAIPRIFDRFYRVATGNVHNVKGYGLGLSYVKTVIDRQGGSIEVESKEGQGTTFIIYL